MNVCLIGSGGREHAIALAISNSKLLDKLFIIPGNPGTKSFGLNVSIDITDVDYLIEFCNENNVELVIVGPEKPLIEGIADQLLENNIKVFGPSKNAARIEGEKSFAKELMKEYNIPTASYKLFNKSEYEKVITYLNTVNYPTVIKADGIAAGKGVVIAPDFDSAKKAVNDCFIGNVFNEAGDKIVIEEFLIGQEASLFAISDGSEFVLLPAAQDYKRIYDGDKGKNTGGMGAYAPTPFVNDELIKLISNVIINPTIQALKEKNCAYIGCLYCGLILTTEGPKVIEFNCRFGDPETQVVLPLLNGDILELFYTAACGKINSNAVKYNGGSSVCVVAASTGYPDEYEKGKEIFGLNNVNRDDVIIYHAGTREKKGKIYTNGGRVLGITSVINNNDLIDAKKIAYETLDNIYFDGIYFRKDISDKALLALNK
ncbi:MAG: phosphoribosylamine--glycine ligase [Ignavibacteria bacterium]|nr:phosphoribosylamine--glycine ligase [Ignavibacteria bacterium]